MLKSTPLTLRLGSVWRTQPPGVSTETGTRSSAPEIMKTSDSSWSRYCGSPLSVLRVTDGSESDQPMPNGPLPAPESYDSWSCGPKLDRPGLAGIGSVNVPVPVAAFAENFSPMPRIAPPPFGSAIAGGVAVAVLADASELAAALPEAAFAGSAPSGAVTCDEALVLSRSLRIGIYLLLGGADSRRRLSFYRLRLAAFNWDC